MGFAEIRLTLLGPCRSAEVYTVESVHQAFDERTLRTTRPACAS